MPQTAATTARVVFYARAVLAYLDGLDQAPELCDDLRAALAQYDRPERTEQQTALDL